jgi:(p)ppGpp synthase/HD superfamily hydrolase
MFAAQKHLGQLYPGSELPYLTHIGAVLLALLPALRENPEMDADLAICCALLHDTVEDTDTPLEEIARHFGDAVAVGVAALTKDKTKSKSDAMRDSLERIEKQPQEIWRVKLADRIANIGNKPPPYWTREKCLAYAEEGEMILQTLGGASDILARELDWRVREWKERYALKGGE